LESKYKVKAKFNSDRNYLHRDEITFIFHPQKGLIDYKIEVRREDEFIRSAGGSLYFLCFRLSDIGNYLSYYWNLKVSDEQNRYDVKYIGDDDRNIPPEIIKVKDQLLQELESFNYIIVAREIGENRRVCIEHLYTHDDKMPTIFDLLYGNYYGLKIIKAEE
jgi:hypothetical protein